MSQLDEHIHLSIVSSAETFEEPFVEDLVDIGLKAKVILFNDEWHTFDEVIEQIIKATGCRLAQAEALTWEVHTRGKAKVYTGEMGQCIKVSSILEEIALRTHIEC